MPTAPLKVEHEHVAVHNHALNVSLKVSGPTWVRFALVRIPIQDLPLRGILMDVQQNPRSESEEDPQDQPLPGIG